MLEDSKGQSAGRGSLRTMLFAASGNLVEYYDYFIYSVTALYFTPSFFPKGDRTTQLLQGAAVFAIGFAVRPVGAWFFGRYADRRGRRDALALSVVLMCAGSMLLALLPTYSTVGRVAPLGLLLARMIQGFSVGGEYGSAVTYMSEVANPTRRAFQSSAQMVTTIAGQLVALLVLGSLQHLLTTDQLKAWGWRVPFFLGGVAAIVALRMRRSIPESTSKKAMHMQTAGSFKELLRTHRRAVLICLGLSPCGPTIFYVFATYTQKYLVNSAGMDVKLATTIVTAVLPVYLLLLPVGALMSDRFGRKRISILFMVLAGATTIPLFTALGQTRSPYMAFVYVVIALAILALNTVASGVIKAALFPLEVRAIGVAVPYALSTTIFGGTAEYIALWLKSVGHEAWFSWYVTFLVVLGLIASFALPDGKEIGYFRVGARDQAVASSPDLAAPRA
jgi:MHS family alpha-ketoglutarate permease-like MFS transporter